MEKDNHKKGAFGPFFLSLSELTPHLLDPTLSETDILSCIQEMSKGFTSKRERIGEYAEDRRRISAYASFYLPTNVPKLDFLLSKLPTSILEDLRHRPFIDMGAGPGTFSLAYALWRKSSDAALATKAQVTAVDASAAMLEQAQKLMAGFFPEVDFQTTRFFGQRSPESLLFFGHSINEMGIHEAYKKIQAIDPEYVAWIEPGTSDFFLELKKLRSDLLSSYDILYPCPQGAACPSPWCHQVLRTTHHPSIERLSQLAGLDRRVLPLSAHIFKRKGRSLSSLNLPVTLRFINETKFSFEYEVCYGGMDEENGTNKNAVIEIQKKGLSKSQEKEFKNADVGERLDFEVEKELQGKLRVKIKAKDQA